MIQRIQTIYLLLASVLTMLMFFLPVAELISTDGQLYTLNYRSISLTQANPPQQVLYTYPMAILFTLIMLLSITAVFLFKNRKLQMRITMLAILLALGATGLMAFYIFGAMDVEIETIHYGLTTIIPLVDIVFLFLAYKGIQKDEKLIKSMDRIR